MKYFLSQEGFLAMQEQNGSTYFLKLKNGEMDDLDAELINQEPFKLTARILDDSSEDRKTDPVFELLSKERLPQSWTTALRQNEQASTKKKFV